MQANPLKYTNVSQDEYDQFKLIAKSKGLNLSGNKDTENLDGMGVAVVYDADKKELTFTNHVPVWMLEATAIGIIHIMVCGAKAQQDEIDAQRRNSETQQTQDNATRHNVAQGHRVTETHAKK